MCAINPKHDLHFVLSVYTSAPMNGAEFTDLVMSKVLEIEQQLNADARLRWHIEERGMEGVELR